VSVSQRRFANEKRCATLSRMSGGYLVAHIACTWHVHILSLSRKAERRSQERRQPFVISHRDSETLRIALIPAICMCMAPGHFAPPIR